MGRYVVASRCVVGDAPSPLDAIACKPTWMREKAIIPGTRRGAKAAERERASERYLNKAHALLNSILFPLGNSHVGAIPFDLRAHAAALRVGAVGVVSFILGTPISL